jgi:hypothetical protein
VGAGSPKENASKREFKARFWFNENRKTLALIITAIVGSGASIVAPLRNPVLSP